jgi:hypothetical protein
MRHARFFLLLAFVAFGTFACRGKDASVAPDAGTTADGVYTNEYFGLTLSIPDGWVVASKESEQMMREAGENAVVQDNAALRFRRTFRRKTPIRFYSSVFRNKALPESGLESLSTSGCSAVFA